jgi:hypothetical protein
MHTRRVIIILSTGSLGALVTAIILVAAPGAYCLSSTRAGSCTAALSIGIFFASALLLVALVTGLVARIMGMLQTIDEKRWGWFITVLLLGAIGSLAYGLAKLETISAGE